MGGTPSGHRAASTLRDAFDAISLEVEVREDPPVEAWEASWSASLEGSGVALEGAWPYFGSAEVSGRWPIRQEPTADGSPFVLLARSIPVEIPPGLKVVLTSRLSTRDGRHTRIGSLPGRVRGSGIAVLGVGSRVATALSTEIREGRDVRLSLELEATSRRASPLTVVATLKGMDSSRFLLFCAHGDSDGGGPGANDNASGVAIVLEIARALHTWVQRHGKLPYDVRFAIWGKEIHSTIAYRRALEQDPSRLLAVLNFDQSGYGASHDAFYVEPDDVPVNQDAVRTVLALAKAARSRPGYPKRFASTRTQGGTDSYVFHGTREADFPSLTLYASAWDAEKALEATSSFPPDFLGTGGRLLVDGDPHYHSSGDTPAATVEREPFNMGHCARLGALFALHCLLVPGQNDVMKRPAKR